MPASDNGDGTLVDTLYYRFKGSELEDGSLSADEEELGKKVTDVSVPLQLRLIKQYDSHTTGKNRPAKSVEFLLRCDNPKFKIKGTDVEALRLAAWDNLDKEFAVKWEPYYLVNIRRGYRSNPGDGFQFEYKDIWRGVAHDGTLLMRQMSYHRGEAWTIKPWPGEFKDEKGNVMACIAATDENTRALDEFARMIDEMRKKLSDFFRPEQIMTTLENLGSLKLLAPGKEEAQ